MLNTLKQNGVVYTPENLVKSILDISGYLGPKILGKHVIDNSCGDGAFLKEIVTRYSNEYIKSNNNIFVIEDLKNDLQKYIHGIEINNIEAEKCQNNLNIICNNIGLFNVNFDIMNANSLEVTKYNGKMDFVIGNPPYVRVHNLKENFQYIKKQKFTMAGMTDLYIIFYEIGINMLNESGILCYINPSSVFNSLAGLEFRKYVIEQKLITDVVDLKHFQPFENITTYTAIIKLDKLNSKKTIKYSLFDEKSMKTILVDNLEYNEFQLDDKFYFGSKKDLKEFRKIIETEISEKKIEVKNGFATLADSIFIKEEFSFSSKFIYKILKGSKSSWKQVIYPYDKNSKVIDFNLFEFELQEYLNLFKKELMKRSLDKGSLWYAFGRSQAVKDFWKNRIAVNTLIRFKNDIRIVLLKPGEGIYSGLYVVGNIDYDWLYEKLSAEKFVNYVKILGKYKSGGYYTFSSSDLKKYIVYNIKGD